MSESVDLYQLMVYRKIVFHFSNVKPNPPFSLASLLLLSSRSSLLTGRRCSCRYSSYTSMVSPPGRIRGPCRPLWTALLFRVPLSSPYCVLRLSVALCWFKKDCVDFSSSARKGRGSEKLVGRMSGNFSCLSLGFSELKWRSVLVRGGARRLMS